MMNNLIQRISRHFLPALSCGLVFLWLLTPVYLQAGLIWEQPFDVDGSLEPETTLQGGKIQGYLESSGWMTLAAEVGTTERVEISAGPIREASTGEATIEFQVKRLDRKREGYAGTSAYNTLMDVIDGNGNSLLTVYLIWEYSSGGELVTAVDIDSSGNPTNLWGRRAVSSRLIKPGEDARVALTWGAKPEECRVFLDGLDITPGYSPEGKGWFTRSGVVSRIPQFREALQSASLIILGVDAVKGRGYIEPATEVLFQRVSIYDELLYRPVISSVTHDAFQAAGFSGKLVAGDTYTVTINAEPGGTATFDLGPVKNHLMTEDPDDPGTYLGTHIVKYGEDVENGELIGHFANTSGIEADTVKADRLIDVDTKVNIAVNPSNDLIPADEESKAGITVVAKDANGKPVRNHELLLTMSTTDEYTGIVGGGSFEDMVGGEIDVDWDGVTDSFGEVTAQYQSGFAAKTILVSAKDMVSGDVGVGYVRSYITGTVDVLVKKPQAVALGLAGSMEVSLSRDWLTADGRSRSRITAIVKDQDGDPLEGHNIQFALLGNNGKIRAIKSWTDSRGRAFADYIAGTVIGEVKVEVRDVTGGHVAVVSIELRSDAPAEIALTAVPGEIFTDSKTGSSITAKVTDANGNPNFNTDVLFEVASGGGTMSADSAVTDEKDGIASVNFLPGSEPGLSTIKATIISRAPTADEVAAAEGAVFLYGLDDDPGRLEVIEWLAEPDDEVTEGQDLVKLEDRHGTLYTVVSPRDGIVAVFTAEEDDRVEYGQTLGYVLPLEE